jgi:hypothetical protein
MMKEFQSGFFFFLKKKPNYRKLEKKKKKNKDSWEVHDHFFLGRGGVCAWTLSRRDKKRKENLMWTRWGRREDPFEVEKVSSGDGDSWLVTPSTLQSTSPTSQKLLSFFFLFFFFFFGLFETSFLMFQKCIYFKKY